MDENDESTHAELVSLQPVSWRQWPGFKVYLNNPLWHSCHPRHTHVHTRELWTQGEGIYKPHHYIMSPHSDTYTFPSVSIAPFFNHPPASACSYQGLEEHDSNSPWGVTPIGNT